jgi:hypothetical protein
MIEGYLNQRAVWKRKTGSNEYGEPVTKQKSIKVRWEGKRRLVRDNQGREVVSEARVFCVEAVQAGDELEHGGRRWPVIAVSTVPGLDGAENHREVAV